jgi:hypothetical protein
MKRVGHEKAKERGLACQNLRHLWAIIFLAEEMGIGLG